MAASVPAGPIYSVREMTTDPHYAARGVAASDKGALPGDGQRPFF